MMTSENPTSLHRDVRLVPKGMMKPFVLLTSLFFLWAIPNNMTDTMLAAFKRIMSLSDSQTAWIQVVCYLLGYGCFAIPGAIFIKKHTYKAGVLLGLGCCTVGSLLFYPAMLANEISSSLSFATYLFAIFILFAGLSVLETSTNSYVYSLGDPLTATRRLNLAQSFNPFGAVTGVILSQIFVLSQLNTLTAHERSLLSAGELQSIQASELQAVTGIYLFLGLLMAVILLSILFTTMPAHKEGRKSLDLRGSFHRLRKNKNYRRGVIAQFFNIGAQISVWSFTIRYAMQELRLDDLVQSMGANPSSQEIIDTLRHVEPLGAGFYNVCEALELDALLPRTAEQAGATYYILSLVLFVLGRFICTWLMKYIKPARLLSIIALLAVACTLTTIYAGGAIGVYALMGISGCLSLMFPTIYGLGLRGLGDDTKIGGSGMVMAIAGAAILTQIQGILSDSSGSIRMAYWVPAFAFIVIAWYSLTVRDDKDLPPHLSAQ